MPMPIWMDKCLYQKVKVSKMEKDDKCLNCGLDVTSLDDHCVGCNTKTKYYKNYKNEITSIWMTSGFALTLLATGIARMLID